MRTLVLDLEAEALAIALGISTERRRQLVLLILLVDEVISLLLGDALAVSLYESLDLRQAVGDVDTLPLVQLCRLEYPQVVPAVVAEGHALPEEVLLQQLHGAA